MTRPPLSMGPFPHLGQSGSPPRPPSLISFLPVSFPPLPSEPRLFKWAAAAPSKPIHGIGIKGTIANWRRLIAIRQTIGGLKCYKSKTQVANDVLSRSSERWIRSRLVLRPRQIRGGTIYSSPPPSSPIVSGMVVESLEEDLWNLLSVCLPVGNDRFSVSESPARFFATLPKLC